jgi:hypothetical protein
MRSRNIRHKYLKKVINKSRKKTSQFKIKALREENLTIPPLQSLTEWQHAFPSKQRPQQCFQQ